MSDADIQPNQAALELLARRLELRSPLSPEDRRTILSLPGQMREVEAHRDLVRPDDAVGNACLVVAGVLAQFAQSHDGARQFTALQIAGDLAALNAVVLPRTHSTLTALTKARVYSIPRAALIAAADASPTLARAFWRECTVEASICEVWLLTVGRLDARERVAHLLCELSLRYEAIGYRRRAFPADLTQAQLGDALGLTAVHVNRTLRTLRDEGAADVSGRQVVIADWDRLADIGHFDARYLHLGQPSGRPIARET